MTLENAKRAARERNDVDQRQFAGVATVVNNKQCFIII